MTSKRSARGPGSQASIPAPPRAEALPLTFSPHGLSWIDDYSWIRADNWREVLRDPTRLPADIRTLLEAENAYADAVLAPTLGLQKELKREMRARLKEDDSEPPQVDGPWAYYRAFVPAANAEFIAASLAKVARRQCSSTAMRAPRERRFFISPARGGHPIIQNSHGPPTISAPRC